jgi:hypothetical protein
LVRGKTGNVGEYGAPGWESGGRAKARTNPGLEEGRLVEVVETERRGTTDHMCAT